MKVLALAGDAGGARALLPVLQRLHVDPSIELLPQAYAAAVAIWKQAGLSPAAPDPAMVRDADRVLLGTSWQAERWEQKIIVAAREAGVRTVSVLDGWANYAVRFLDESDQLVLPDAIAVMDQRGVDEMVTAGFSRDRLHITGQPAFEETMRYRRPETARAAHQLVTQEWQLGPNEMFFLFASQPFSALGGESWGFTEQEVLRDCVGALHSLLSIHRRHALLLIKRHPRETGPLWAGERDLPSPLRLVEVGETAVDYRKLITATDAVLGMNSNLLLEACIIGRPVISYQPHLQRPDPLPSNRWGASRLVSDPAELETALREEIFDDTRRSIGGHSAGRVNLVPHATDNVVKLLLG